MRKITVLLLSSPALSQVLEHLFRSRPEFEVVGRIRGLRGLGQHAERLLPELIIANVKPLSRGMERTVASIKQASPGSKLIVICPVLEFSRAARRSGADGCLRDEQLTGNLLRMARDLAARPAQAATGD